MSTPPLVLIVNGAPSIKVVANHLSISVRFNPQLQNRLFYTLNFPLVLEINLLDVLLGFDHVDH